MYITPSMEKYLASIYELGKDGQVVRVKNVVHKMNVKMASVTRALQNFAKNDLIHYSPYQYIELSSVGAELARGIHNRQRILTSFLKDSLGIDPDIAKEDSRKLNYILNRKSMDGLLMFMERHNSINVSEEDLIDFSAERKDEKNG